ncbi:MAG TPA: tyrosine--tRNA ligase [Candidatus Paceibacterota bacterium]|jgi:tyrosyl-tRNA synthetase|nr:tyrosine--tRNA ligase [Candidatus Paceibacterota bacterium]
MEKRELIDTLLNKGVAEILPSRGFLEKELSSGRTLTIYAGFDPTAPTLHIGHSISLRKLRHFQDLGHKIIFLVGDFTARIGDPTDKSSARKQLTEKEIKTNLKKYKQQAGKFIRFSGKNSAKIKFNNDWLGKMKFADVLALASQMTVDQMLKRDMFARRIEEEKPIYIHEFMYPLMQGYDSVAMDVDGEVGGNDQLFNMMTGRTLLKQLKNKEKFVITTKLLEDNNGKKMGKSEGNMISLIDSPEQMYGKIMSWTDGLIVPGFELCTDYTLGQISFVKDELNKGINPRDIKMRLAFEIVKACTNEKSAQKAEEAFVATFQKKEANDSIAEIAINGRTLETFLIEENIVSSKSELRRLIEGGAVTNFENKEPVSLEETKQLMKAGVYKIGKSRVVKAL